MTKTLIQLTCLSIAFITFSASSCGNKETYLDDENIMPFCGTCEIEEHDYLCYNIDFDIEEAVSKRGWLKSRIRSREERLQRVSVYQNPVSVLYGYEFYYLNGAIELFDCEGNKIVSASEDELSEYQAIAVGEHHFDFSDPEFLVGRKLY